LATDKLNKALFRESKHTVIPPTYFQERRRPS